MNGPSDPVAARRGFAGVDPGLSGGLALVSPDGALLATSRMPVHRGATGEGALDLRALRDLLRSWSPRAVFVERQHPMPRQGLCSTFTTGRNYGMLLATLALGDFHTPALGDFRIVIDHAKAWQKTYKGVAAGGGSAKATALAIASALWPSESWMATEKSRRPHDGIIDAALMAEHLRRQECSHGPANAFIAIPDFLK
ncbi:MAG TPA: hypothetical protein VLI39_07545 [Sedimentisphaerales bacterium]|nr:hypothetical protein [Sedimentisphaerales bacterium]